MKVLKDQIIERFNSVKGTKALYLKNIETNEEITINHEEKFHAASIIKLYYLYEALRQVQKNKLKLNQIFKLPEIEKVDGCGVLKILHNNIELTLEDLLNLMIDVSDNTATNMLFDILGKDNINCSLREININNTYVARKLMKVIPGTYNYTTAKDVGKILEEFYNPKTLKKDLATKAIEILSKQQYNDSISKDLIRCGKCGKLIKNMNYCDKCNTFVGDIDPIPVFFPHKTGEISGVVHDAGIMYTFNKRIIVVVLTKNLDNNLVGKDILSKVGIHIYKYLESNA